MEGGSTDREGERMAELSFKTMPGSQDSKLIVSPLERLLFSFALITGLFRTIPKKRNDQ